LGKLPVHTELAGGRHRLDRTRPDAPYAAIADVPRGHDGLHKYPGNARYRAVDAHDGWNAGDVMNWPNNRAPSRRYASLEATSKLPAEAPRLVVMGAGGNAAHNSDRLSCPIPIYPLVGRFLRSWRSRRPKGRRLLGKLVGPGVQPDALPGASVHCPGMLAAGAPAVPVGGVAVGGALVR